MLTVMDDPLFDSVSFYNLKYNHDFLFIFFFCLELNQSDPSQPLVSLASFFNSKLHPKQDTDTVI